MYVLVDCNNFYASCERVFNPSLEGKPIIILSNNDGCIISRSSEAKALGIKMGEPYFKAKNICKRHKVNVFSSNYQFYGDMSDRVMKILTDAAPEIEIYSIDEAFLKFEGLGSHDLTKTCLELRERILKYLGLPVSIGIGKTKTLAKVASHIAKKQGGNGVFNLSSRSIEDEVLNKFPVGDVWGIGKKWSQKLQDSGIYSAKDMRDAPHSMIRKDFTVVGQRVNHELKGVSCIGLEEVQDKKNIMTSRSFGRSVYELHELKESIAFYTARACEKLRAQKSYTKAIYVFVTTNKFKANIQKYKSGLTYSFANPTNDTLEITGKATELMQAIFKDGLEYKKAGILLMDLTKKQGRQESLFSESNRTLKFSDSLMTSLDYLNNKYGNNIVHTLAEGTKKHWMMNCKNRSPRYTTQWSELLEIR